MISVFTLSQAITENASRAIDNVPAYEFATDNLDECSAEFQFMLANEASNMREFIASTDEILAEAVFSNPASVDSLNENVFETLKNGVINFFNKIIAMVKGLIEKLKAFFYKMTGKTDKWLKIMEPKIAEAKRKTGYGDVSMEMYSWNDQYITATSGDSLAGGLDKMVAQWRADVNGGKSNAEMMKLLKEIQSAQTKIVNKSGGEDADSSDTKDSIDAYQKEAEYVNGETEKFKQNAADTIGKAWGVKATSMDVLTGELRKKATGGAEKTEKKFGNETDKMVAAIKNSTKTIEAIKKAYETHLKHLTDFKSELEKQGDGLGKLTKSGEKAPDGIIRGATDLVKAHYNKAMEITRTYEAAMNSVRNLNTSLIQEMCTEYMSALGKFASFKGTK